MAFHSFQRVLTNQGTLAGFVLGVANFLAWVSPCLSANPCVILTPLTFLISYLIDLVQFHIKGERRDQN